MEEEYFEQENIEGREQPKKGNWLPPVSILIAGVMITGSLIYLVGKQSIAQKSAAIGDGGTVASSAKYGEVPPLGGRDAIAWSSNPKNKNFSKNIIYGQNN